MYASREASRVCKKSPGGTRTDTHSVPTGKRMLPVKAQGSFAGSMKGQVESSLLLQLPHTFLIFFFKLSGLVLQIGMTPLTFWQFSEDIRPIVSIPGSTSLEQIVGVQ